MKEPANFEAFWENWSAVRDSETLPALRQRRYSVVLDRQPGENRAEHRARLKRERRAKAPA